jgi:hypothetical protein
MTPRQHIEAAIAQLGDSTQESRIAAQKLREALDWVPQKPLSFEVENQIRQEEVQCHADIVERWRQRMQNLGAGSLIYAMPPDREQQALAEITINDPVAYLPPDVEITHLT